VSYDGREFYTLPDIDRGRLRQTLVRGLDAGDREVGVFAHHGLDVVQPYAFVADDYLSLPAALLREGVKQTLSRQIAGDLVPGFVFDRVKVRAQIGSSTEPTGILPVLIGHGFDGQWLRRTFCRIFGIQRETFLNGFIRAGRYRVIDRDLAGRPLINGYIAA
jgi:hypothetical protein